MVTIKHSDFRGDRCGAQARRRVSVFKGSFLCLKKIAGQDQPVSWASPTAHRNILAFLREKRWSSNRATCCWRVSCQQFSRREQIPPATRVCFGSSISPPEKARIFSYIICTATFLSYLLGLLGQATDTKPQEIQVQQRSGICSVVLAKTPPSHLSPCVDDFI